MQVDGVGNVKWLFGLQGLDRAKRDLVADRVCGLEEIELDHQQVWRPELLPEDHHIQPRSKPLPKEPSVEERRAHELTHLPARSWCETCVKSFGLEDPHRRRRGGRDLPELQVDFLFMGRRGEKELICALHAIDTEFLARTVIRADTGPIDFVIHGILEFLGEIGRKSIVIRTRPLMCRQGRLQSLPEVQGLDLQRRGVRPLRVHPVRGAVPGGGEAGRRVPPRCLGWQDLEVRRPPDLRRR